MARRQSLLQSNHARNMHRGTTADEAKKKAEELGKAMVIRRQPRMEPGGPLQDVDVEARHSTAHDTVYLKCQTAAQGRQLNQSSAGISDVSSHIVLHGCRGGR